MSGICSKSISEAVLILFHRTAHWRCCAQAWRGLAGSVCSVTSLQRNPCYTYLTHLISLEGNAKNDFWAVVVPFSKGALKRMKHENYFCKYCMWRWVEGTYAAFWRCLQILLHLLLCLSVGVKHSNWILVCKAIKTKPRPKHFSAASQRLFDSCCPASTA